MLFLLVTSSLKAFNMYEAASLDQQKPIAIPNRLGLWDSGWTKTIFLGSPTPKQSPNKVTALPCCLLDLPNFFFRKIRFAKLAILNSWHYFLFFIDFFIDFLYRFFYRIEICLEIRPVSCFSVEQRFSNKIYFNLFDLT